MPDKTELQEYLTLCDELGYSQCLTIDQLISMVKEKQPTLCDWEILCAFDIWWQHRDDTDKLSFRCALAKYYMAYGKDWK